MMLFYAGAKVYHRLCTIGKPGPAFCVDNGISRCFVRFDGYDEFEKWYSKLSPNKRTLSEIVTLDMRKLILDIDSPDDAVLEKMFMYDFERHVTSGSTTSFSRWVSKRRKSCSTTCALTTKFPTMQ